MNNGIDEERKANKEVMETKWDCILAALARHKSYMPESVRDAKKRLRWLDRHIAEEETMLFKSKQRFIKDWIKKDKAAEQRRQREIERQDRL